VIQHRIYRNGGLHRTVPLQHAGMGVQHAKWWHVLPSLIGTTQSFYVTAVNIYDEESVPSITQFVTINPCGPVPTVTTTTTTTLPPAVRKLHEIQELLDDYFE
jgi:hypothetical protein